MTVTCSECGSVNKKGNKFCFECGFRLPETEPARGPIPASKAKALRLKKMWLQGELTAEEYRAKLLRLRLKEKFKQHSTDEEEPTEE